MSSGTSLPTPSTPPRISRFVSRDALGRAAAAESAEILRTAIAARGFARVLVATGNSQLDVVKHLVGERVDWNRVDALHLDEYVGIEPTHPASFQLWIRTRFVDKVHPRSIDYLQGLAADPDAEARRYAALLASGPIDLAFVGFGENGHIAFNDPHVADFADPLLVKRVALDEACRRQQVGEGHYPNLDSVPREALTVTCTGLMRAAHWICCVPEGRKASAVRAALEGPLTTACPASLVRNHPRASIYLDLESSALLAQSRAIL